MEKILAEIGEIKSKYLRALQKVIRKIDNIHDLWRLRLNNDFDFMNSEIFQRFMEIIKSHKYMAYFNGERWCACDTRIIDPSDYELEYEELVLFSYPDFHDNCQHFIIGYDYTNKDKFLELEFFEDKDAAALFIETI